MARALKCQQCGEKDQLDKVKVPKNEAKTQFKYFHPKCYDKYLKEKEFTDQETKEWDELYWVVSDILNKEIVPTQLCFLMQDLRNGTITYKGKKIKRYKDGVKYPIIKEAFILARKDIEYAKRTKVFKNESGESFYVIAIVTGKINEVSIMQKKKERQEAMKQARRDKQTKVEEAKKVEYKKKSHSTDISAFLDD